MTDTLNRSIQTTRELLAQLRDVMAGEGSPENRLNRTVALIAAGMVADVCSCYVLRAGEVLELFATEGLKKTAIHQTRLRVGEGLVGAVAARARPLATSDAPSHPLFAYRPETGEEKYTSFLGVPIIRRQRVIGVLVVQNSLSRSYTDIDSEFLETVAMVIAELLGSSDLISREELAPVDGNASLPLRIEGITLNQGVGVGPAVLHQPRVWIHNLVAENPDAEWQRLRTAISHVQASLDYLFEQMGESSGEHRDVLETYRMFTEDKGWLSRIGEAIRSGLTAEAAVQKVHDDMAARFAQIADPYLRERLRDFEDLANRLLRYLAGDQAPRLELPDNAVLVARSLAPMELLDYDYTKLSGLILAEGSPTEHVIIVARALNLPVVGRIFDALERIDDGDVLVVDADNGMVFVRPSDDVLARVAETLEHSRQKVADYARLAELPSTTKDGHPITLMMNAGLLLDMPHLDSSRADGIGLYRTELPFMSMTSLPDVTTQTNLYSRILDLAGDRPVSFRTLDVGGDKILPYWVAPAEANPALGWRSIRITLDRPAILRTQLRALLHAAAGRKLRVMFPMITTVAELKLARHLLDMELERAKAHNQTLPDSIAVGSMLEVPALVFQLDSLLPLVDFIAVGTNDLSQFLFAADRNTPLTAGRYDHFSPALLSLIRMVQARCDIHRVPLSVCGEMASNPLGAMALIGCGVTMLSVSAQSIGPVKRMIRSLDVAPLRYYINSLLPSGEHSLRVSLYNFAQDHGVLL